MASSNYDLHFSEQDVVEYLHMFIGYVYFLSCKTSLYFYFTDEKVRPKECKYLAYSSMSIMQQIRASNLGLAEHKTVYKHHKKDSLSKLNFSPFIFIFLESKGYSPDFSSAFRTSSILNDYQLSQN